jgi:hypothetical protein
MIDRATRDPVCRPSCVTPFLYLAILFCAARIIFAAAVGNQVELNVTHRAGVPLHKEP